MNRHRRHPPRGHVEIESCEICGLDIDRRSEPHRRRCLDHLAGLVLIQQGVRIDSATRRAA
jgi:hypothetical protein